jgi:hypothetical protein
VTKPASRGHSVLRVWSLVPRQGAVSLHPQSFSSRILPGTQASPASPSLHLGSPWEPAGWELGSSRKVNSLFSIWALTPPDACKQHRSEKVAPSYPQTLLVSDFTVIPTSGNRGQLAAQSLSSDSITYRCPEGHDTSMQSTAHGVGLQAPSPGQGPAWVHQTTQPSRPHPGPGCWGEEDRQRKGRELHVSSTPFCHPGEPSLR